MAATPQHNILGKDKACAKYSRYWEAEATTLAKALEKRELGWQPAQFQHVLVIPAFDEAVDFLSWVFHQLRARRHKLLVILVINQPRSRPSQQQQNFWQHLHQHHLCRWQLDNLHYLKGSETAETPDLLLVDRFSSPQNCIDDDKGVGLARKIGADLAFAGIQAGMVQNPWIHTTDADAQLPADYFADHRFRGASSALAYPFAHVANPSDTDEHIFLATRRYERKLNDYVKGLASAGSPYAFHTIGSCIAVHARAYAQVRGFPTRAGGEDFYLLNKLNKIAPVVTPAGEPILLLARRSARAPFGTGPAVENLLAGETPRTYHPAVFSALKALLAQRATLWHLRDNYPEWLSSLATEIQSACQALDMEHCFKHLAAHTQNQAQCQQQFDQWFDGFKTLKFIQHLQTHHYPKISID